ncbi:MAG: hypothetical protein PVG71_09680, partial [Anaerolineae bacterium]
MSLLQSFLELITSQSGALVYHLVTLFAIQLMLGVAVGHWQRRRDEASARLLALGIGFFLARMILMVVAVLDRGALLSSDVVLPPLERFLDLATLVLVAWAFSPIPGQSPGQNARLSTALLIAALLVAAGTYAAFATLWPGVEAQGLAYNGYWQERAWEVSTTATLVLALIVSMAWRGADWGWLGCLLGLWLAGHGLQLIAPVTDASSAGWVRLANLAALPLLAALVYRRALAATSPLMKESEVIDKQKESAAAPAEWQDEVRKLNEARDALRTQLSHWQDEAERLSRAKAELEEQLARAGSSESTDG